MVTTESVIMFAFLPTKFARVPAYLPQPQPDATPVAGVR